MTIWDYISDFYQTAVEQGDEYVGRFTITREGGNIEVDAWSNTIQDDDGVDTFRCFVEAWYAGGFQKIIFHQNASKEVREMICAILAGYAWDKRNPYVAENKRRLAVLEELCSA